jgi:hypothetical protein
MELYGTVHAAGGKGRLNFLILSGRPWGDGRETGDWEGWREILWTGSFR